MRFFGADSARREFEEKCPCPLNQLDCAELWNTFEGRPDFLMAAFAVGLDPVWLIDNWKLEFWSSG